jgi:threonylcarbamoyladenosine tRNA methylthiotransferase MtaB
MPQLPKALRRERAARLREAGAAAVGAYLKSQVGATAQVLVERDGMGRTEHFAPVIVGAAARNGALISARILAANTDRLIADEAAA